MKQFPAEAIRLGESLVQRRVPLAEAVAALGLLEESIHALFPHDSQKWPAAFGKLSHLRIIYLTTAYFGSPAALAGEQIDAQERAAASLPPSRRARFGGPVGASRPMRALYQRIETAGQLRDTVLIQGESGTGKALAARAIHQCGPHERRQFVAIDCAALPRNLIDSELFGHCCKSVDGGDDECLGVLRAAEGGTAFIDEIEEIESATRSGLLGAITGQKVRPVGAMREQLLDVRVIISVSSNRLEPTAWRRSREELCERLQAFVIEVPPLRERREDIPMLVEHFIALFNRRFNHSVAGVMPAALQALVDYSWPGNVRELFDVIESALQLVRRADHIAR